VSEWWDTPFFLCIALSMFVLLWRPVIGPVERALSFFGIGGVDAAIAEALVIGTAGLFGLLFNDAAAHVWASAYGPGHLALALGSGLSLGMAVAWLAGRLHDPDAGGKL
jgi:hypothetical protein